jgi:hypothetical protein
MGSPFDPIDHGSSGTEQVSRVEGRHISRTVVATTRRGIDDIKKGIEEVAKGLMHQGFDEEMTVNEVAAKFLEAQRLRAELNAVLARTEAMLPNHGNAKLTENEKKQIRGLYSTGLYTQTQLAGQYGVQQPTISEIIRG